MRRRWGPAILAALVACRGVGVPMDVSEAVETGDTTTLKRLLEAGADPDLPIVNQMTPLMRAAVRGGHTMVGLLIHAGADVSRTGLGDVTAVHLAAVADSVESIAMLAAAGADLEAIDRGGMRPIDHAAWHGSVAVIDYLVDRAGLDPNSRSSVFTQGHGYPRDRGPTPLAIATRAGDVDAMQALLDLGAAVDGTSESGQTALLTAIFSDQSPEVVQLLLGAGADTSVTARCMEGCSVEEELSALAWAVELGRSELVDLLESG